MSLGIFPFPLPKPRITFPWHSIPPNLCSLSLQVLLSSSSTLLRFLSLPLRSPPPLLLHQIPTCPLAPSQFTAGTADVTLLPGAHNLGPKLPGILALGSPSAGTRGHWCWGPGGASEGTARFPRGQWLLAPPHTLSLGCWGVVGGGGPCGDTAKPAPGIKPDSAGTAGPGVRVAAAQARAPGAGMTPGGWGGGLCGSGRLPPRAGAPRRRPALPPSCLPVRGAPARAGPRLPGLAASGSRYMVPSSPAPSGLLRAARGRALLRRRCRAWGRATPGGGSEGGGRAGCTEPRSRGAGAARQPSRPPAEHAAAAAAEPRRASSLRPARRVCAPERV